MQPCSYSTTYAFQVYSLLSLKKSVWPAVLTLCFLILECILFTMQTAASPWFHSIDHPQVFWTFQKTLTFIRLQTFNRFFSLGISFNFFPAFISVFLVLFLIIFIFLWCQSTLQVMKNRVQYLIQNMFPF